MTDVMQPLVRGLYQSYPEMGDKFRHKSGLAAGVRYPLLYPATLQEEDEEREQGHLTLSRVEWLNLMFSWPRHLLVTCAVR